MAEEYEDAIDPRNPGASNVPAQGGGHSTDPSSPLGEAFKAPEQPKRPRSATYSMTKEKLLLTYRYMKGRLAEQPFPPTTIYIPPNVIYRRFGFAIALGKLIKVGTFLPFEHVVNSLQQMNPSLNTIEFTGISPPVTPEIQPLSP